MAIETSNKDKETLNRIKKNVEKSYQYDRQNYERFNQFRKFIFKTSLNDDDISLLQARKMPQIEFNIGEAHISRLLGEFSKQEPSISVESDDGNQVDPKVINVVEGHLRHILFEGNKNGTDYEVYKDQLSGGFSVYKVFTKYANEKSFEHIICYERAFDPILCGFDPLAKFPTKWDGKYCFEIYPKLKDDFKEEYPSVDISELSFIRDQDGFNWSYSSDKNDFLLMCDYYEKKKKKETIVKIASIYPRFNKKVITLKQYEQLLEWWDEQGIIAQKPAIIGKPRKTEITKIERFIFVENEIIERKEINFKYFPLVYVPGNDIMIRDSINGASYNMTRPYTYHLMGAQKLKNFAGQNLANELENMVQHKWIAAAETIPDEEDWLDAWRNPQQASTFVYNHINKENPDQPLPAPREIQRAQIPQEITNTFVMMDQLTQNILGSYDASLGINDNQLSGVAIVEGATQSNAAAKPYIVSNLLAKQQLAEIFIDLFPKYYLTPMTIPITTLDGKKSYIKINGEGGMKFNYDENSLKVKVEAGVNFSVQKDKALKQIIALQQSSPQFAQFMQESGLEIILDNLEIRGIDHLKQLAGQWMQEQKQKQAQAMQMQQQAMMNNPQMIKAKSDIAKVQLDAKAQEQDYQLKIGQLGLDKQIADTDRLKAFGELGIKSNSLDVQRMKSQSEDVRSFTDLKLKEMDMRHRHTKEIRDNL